MNIGVVVPQTEYGSHPTAIADYAQTAEGLGFSHILAYDHVLGANPNRPGGWRGPYTYQTPFHEPLLLFSYMAAITDRIGFTPGVIILPQRQTALVAKQAATLDVLSSGRLRLGVGLGWNQVEYTSLNEDFHNRGKRLEEQVSLMRLLWTEPLVDFKGTYHTIPDAGVNPLPVQKPIPIWFGGTAEPALRRAARLGNGWLVNIRTPAEAAPAFDVIFQELEAAGRSRADYGIEARIPFGDGNPATWRSLIQDWLALGATMFSVNTMGQGFDAQGHLAAIQKFAKEVDLT